MSEEPTLKGDRWLLIAILIDGRSVPNVLASGADITFTDDGNVYGYGGCNRYFGGCEVEGGNIKFSAIASTRMYCQETMELEDAFLKALDLVTIIELTGEGLDLVSVDGDTRLSFKKG